MLGVGYWLAALLFIDTTVSESAENITDTAENGQYTIISEGMFVDADGFHKGEGMAKLIKTGEKYFVRFEDNFKVTNGPDLFVYFGKEGRYAKEAQLAALKGNIGAQNYEVPEGVDPTQYSEVWIWCHAFSVPFAHAVLEEVSVHPSPQPLPLESEN